jgi:hypothetical protein
MSDNFRYRVYRALGMPLAYERGNFKEPVEAIEAAEDWLLRNGKPGFAYAEIIFNGDNEIHMLMKRTDGNFLYELWNSPAAKWPVMLVEEAGGGSMMPDHVGTNLHGAIKDKNARDEAVEKARAKAGKKKQDQKSDANDFQEHEKSENGGAEAEAGEDDEAESGESGTGESDDEGNGETEEVPRVQLFGKFKGPKGWRKRAESDPEKLVNRFQFVIGKLNPMQRSTYHQERDKLVTITFTESDDDREYGELRLRFSEEVEAAPGYWSKSLTVRVPFQKENS